VLARHEERLDQARKASEPRDIAIRVARAKNYKIDIYKMANLRFVLTNQTTGEKTSSSPIRFEGSTAVAKATVPPGSYILALLKFKFRAGIDIGPNDPKQVPINIRLTSSGIVVRKG
jgi:hypothetical protein